MTPRPQGKTWSTAELHRVYLGLRAPSGMAGLRLVWAIVGYKWVRLCTPGTNIKIKIRRNEWDGIPLSDRKLWINPDKENSDKEGMTCH